MFLYVNSRHPTPLAEQIDQDTQKLRRYFDRIAHCHVVVVAPHKHHRHGRHYSIHVELGVPRGPLVVNHEPDARPNPAGATRAPKRTAPNVTHEDIYVALRDTFDVVRRRLEDYARKLRGDTGQRVSRSREEND